MANPIRVADIVPNLDPSRYRTGATEIEALNKKLASSFGALGDAEKAQAEAFARTRTEASAATTSYERLLGRTDQFQAATNKTNDAINRAARAWQQNKISIEEFVRISTSAQAQLDATRDKFARIGQAANDNVAGLRGYGSALGSIEGAASSLTGRLGAVGGALSALGPIGIAVGVALGTITAGLGAIIPAGEKIKQLEGALKVATGSAEGAAAAFGSIYDSAQRIGAPLEASVQLFGRMSMAAKDLGATRSDVLKLTETIQKFAVAGGASTQEAASGAQQLGQALASGVLQGDELRSILENMPLLARAIADGLGTSVGRLREMGAAGELTADKVFKAILAQGDKANALFAQFPDTVERAQTRMGNAWDAFLARLDKAIGASEKLAAIYNGIAKLLDSTAPKSDNERLGDLLAERDRLQLSRNQGGLLGQWFQDADAERLKKILAEIADLEERRDRALRGGQSEQAQLRQDVYKREYDANVKLNASLDETLAAYRQQTDQLRLSEIEQRKLAAAEKARVDYLKANGIETGAQFAALQVSDPGRAVALSAAADAASKAASNLVDDQRKKDLDDYNRALKDEQRILAASPAARYKVQAAIEAEGMVRKGLIAETEKGLYQSQIEAKLYGQAADAVAQQSNAARAAIAGNLALADAWEKGGGAAEIAAAKMKAHGDAAGKTAVNEARLAIEIRNTNAAATAADLAKRNADLVEMNTSLVAAIEAEKKGAQAVADYELAEKKRSATVKARAELEAATDEKVRAALERQIKKTEEQIDIEARRQASRKAAALEYQQQQNLGIALAEREIAAEADPSRRAAMEQALALKQAEVAIRRENVNASDDEIQRQIRLAEEIIKTQAETRRLGEIRDKGKQLFDDLANMLNQAGQNGGKNFAKSLRDYGLAAIETLKRELLFRPIFQPIPTGIVGAVPQLFGIAGAPGAAAGAGSLGSIMSPITDILGMARTFVGDAFSGVTSWINGIGSSLGFASSYAAPMAAHTALGVAGIPGGVSGTAMGTATSTGGLFGATSLTGLLGAAGLGFAGGGLLASLMGGNSTTGSIGGGLGAGAGLLLGGPIGAILGGLGGSVLGGLLGGDESRPLGNAELGAVKNGRLSVGINTSLDGYDNSKEIAQVQQAVQTVNAIIDKFGLGLDEALLARGFGDASNPIGLIGKTSTFDGPKDINEWFQRFFAGREGQSYLTGATGTLKDAFGRLSSGAYKADDAEGVMKMLEYAAGFDDAAKRAAAGVNTLARQTLEWEIAARDAGKSLAKTTKDFIDQAVEYFGAGSTQAKQAALTQQQSLYGMMGLDPSGNAIVPGSSDMLTGRDAELAQAKAQMGSFRDALIATGLTAEQAAAAIDKANTAQAAAINARWDETDRRTTFGLNQRQQSASLMAYGARSGVTANQMAVDAMKEGHRQEYIDAEAAGMSKLNLERMKSIQLIEEEALRVQQAEQTQRSQEAMTDRKNAALVTLGRMDAQAAETASMQSRHRQEMWDAEHSGMDEAMRLQLQHTQQLEAEALAYSQAVQAAQAAAQKQAAIIQSLASVDIAKQTSLMTFADKKLDKATEDVAKAEQALSEARSAATQAINEQVSAWKSAAESLKSAREQILVGQLSPKDSYQQMLTAQGFYNTAKAGSSDPEVAAKLGGYAQQYLQAAMAYYGPNADYAKLFDEVTGTLSTTETLAQQQTRLAQGQLDKLKEIGKSTLSIEEATAQLAAAQAAKTTAETEKTNAGTTANAALKARFEGLAAQNTTYVSDLKRNNPTLSNDDIRRLSEEQFGNTRNDIIRAITDWKVLNQIGEQYYKGMNASTGAPEADAIRVRIWELGGSPSFAMGGMHAGGLRLVGERGPELEATGPARYWSNEQTRSMLMPTVRNFDMPRMPTMAANDQTAALLRQVVDRLERLERRSAAVEKNTETGNRIAVAAGEANVQGLGVNARQQADTARAVKRAGVAR